MKIELTPENAAALVKYAASAGHTPADFLNRYLAENMVALFENPKSGDLESHLGNLEYRTQADAERVVAWIEKRVTERSQGVLRSKQKFLKIPKAAISGSRQPPTANGLTYPV